MVCKKNLYELFVKCSKSLLWKIFKIKKKRHNRELWVKLITILKIINLINSLTRNQDHTLFVVSSLSVISKRRHFQCSEKKV